jgi:hypothetical protein
MNAEESGRSPFDTLERAVLFQTDSLPKDARTCQTGMLDKSRAKKTGLIMRPVVPRPCPVKGLTPNTVLIASQVILRSDTRH